MSVRGRRVPMLLLLTVASMLLIGASPQLNPKVQRLPQPAGPVSAECEEGVAPTPVPPRVATQELLEEAEAVAPATLDAPPTRDLRGQLREALRAAERNDRATFREALTDARATLATYPPGAERSSAMDAVRALEDLDRIWTHQLESPTGAFFDESSELYGVANSYRGYGDAVRRQVITDASGRRFYPTAETREFVLREAGRRLSTLGIQPAARPRSAERRTTPAVVPQDRDDDARPQPSATARRSTRNTGGGTSVPSASATRPSGSSATWPSASTSRPSASTSRPSRRATSSSASASPSSTSRRQPMASRRSTAASPSSSPVPPPAPVATPAPAPIATTMTTPPADLAPVLGTTPSSPSAGSAPASPGSTPADTAGGTTDTATGTTDTAPTTDTTATTAADAESPSTTTTAPAQPGRSRSMVVPIILILIGVGVLIVLFRASS